MLRKKDLGRSQMGGQGLFALTFLKRRQGFGYGGHRPLSVLIVPALRRRALLYDVLFLYSGQ